MARIDFFADSFGIQNNNLNGSGLGFYGEGFGASVEVGTYQTTTFITNNLGVAQGPQVNNVKWTHASSGSMNGAAGKKLIEVPNYLATLNVRFTHDVAVRTQNGKLRIYDRTNINNNPSGVTCKVAELIHPDTVQTANGSGDATWIQPVGSSLIMDMSPSPGLSGLYAGNGTNSVYNDMRHDWYLALSASPDSIGSKTMFALYFETEYL